ncbi:MAG: hypothetical protein LH630_04920 [Actinomycetia bacterium]|nr:hypothetical protein [Actinomycetes bacterium]
MTRRRLLTAAVGVPLLLSASACTEDPPVAPPTDPARDALEAARSVEVTTLESLQNWSVDAGTGTAPVIVGEVLIGHVAALDEALGTSPTPRPLESTDRNTALTLKGVIDLLDAAAAAHTKALRTAPAAVSPLLASIAASDAVLAAATRRGRR